MSLGQVTTILVCQPSSASTTSSYCPTGQDLIAKQAYILEPSSQEYFDKASEPFDYALASGYFSGTLCFILALFFMSRAIGMVYKAV